MSENIKKLYDMVRSGNIATDFAIGGSLLPDQVRNFFDLIIDQSQFMQRISPILGKKQTIPLSMLTISSRQLVRVAEGSEPTTEKASVSEGGHSLVCKPAQLFADLPFGTIEDNLDNPSFESEWATVLARQFANDILDLGTNGTDDDYTGSAFLELNKGWITLAKADSTKVDVTGDADILASFDKMLAGHTQKFLIPGVTSFIVGPADARNYNKLMSAAGYRDPQAATPPRYLGFPIVENPFQPSGTYLLCDPKELVFGMTKDVKRFREVNARARCVEYTWDFYFDYGIARYTAVTVGYEF